MYSFLDETPIQKIMTFLLMVVEIEVNEVLMGIDSVHFIKLAGPDGLTAEICMKFRDILAPCLTPLSPSQCG